MSLQEAKQAGLVHPIHCDLIVYMFLFIIMVEQGRSAAVSVAHAPPNPVNAPAPPPVGFEGVAKTKVPMKRFRKRERINIWDLPTDYYLHNPTVRTDGNFVAEPSFRSDAWWQSALANFDANLLLVLPAPHGTIDTPTGRDMSFSLAVATARSSTSECNMYGRHTIYCCCCCCCFVDLGVHLMFL